MTVRLLVAGPSGRMGKAVFGAAHAISGIEMVGVIADPVLTADKGPLIAPAPDGQGGERPISILPNVAAASGADVLVDFTVPVAAVDLAMACADNGVALVTGTTGLSDREQTTIVDASRKIPVVQSGNFSLGVNALMALVEKAARALHGFDIEVTETHHRRKIDSPSGTALMLGEAAARGRDTTLTEKAVFERYGQVGPRKDGEIGFSVVRGGGVVGDHDVSFLAESEVVTISHRAIDRGLFAQGAVRAAQWAKDQPPGLYSMRDVLGLG